MADEKTLKEDDEEEMIVREVDKLGDKAEETDDKAKPDQACPHPRCALPLHRIT